MLFPNVCYLVQMVVQAVLNFSWLYAFHATFKTEAIFTCGFVVQESSSRCGYSFHCPFTPSSRMLPHPASPMKQQLAFPLFRSLLRNISSWSCFSLGGNLQGLTFLQGTRGKRPLCRGTCCLVNGIAKYRVSSLLFIWQPHFPPILF